MPKKGEFLLWNEKYTFLSLWTSVCSKIIYRIKNNLIDIACLLVTFWKCAVFLKTQETGLQLPFMLILKKVHVLQIIYLILFFKMIKKGIIHNSNSQCINNLKLPEAAKLANTFLGFAKYKHFCSNCISYIGQFVIWKLNITEQTWNSTVSTFIWGASKCDQQQCDLDV